MKKQLLSALLVLISFFAGAQTANPNQNAVILYGFTNKVVSGNTVTYSFTMQAGTGYIPGQLAYGQWNATNFRFYVPKDAGGNSLFTSVSFTPASISGLTGSAVKMAAAFPVGTITNTITTVDKYQLALARDRTLMADLSASTPTVMGTITFVLSSFANGTMPGLKEFPFYDSLTHTGTNAQGWDNGFGSFWADSDVDTYRMAFAPGTSPGPLPVHLLDFDAAAMQQMVKINWSTAVESGVDYYGVERSTDALVWEELGRVKARGLATQQSYSFKDEHPVAGVRNYYRLKMAEADGRYGYSPVRSVLMSEGGSTGTGNGLLSIYPNPASGNIRLMSSDNTPAEIRILSMDGKVAASFSQVQPGDAMSLSGLAAGTYQVIISQGSRQSRSKLSVIR